ncbi:MBL fold metallo-hydrolase [Alicyclobacillus tolerans]|uniref:MBL fold metallo-hydrolase n=1 Tax=Alicyclobacillus tolerans TaxID=90970 RepID=UPI001F16286B|nr:MBL fold metallo-hydrolase [Alicyclobacillus tolerans]MCF8564214.1 MBL fold metallo-hydrolase [Alicyclobacillus tolerans]
MRIHVLGYWGAYPAPGEATTGYLIETDDQKVLLDCGSGVLAQLTHICPVSDLSAVVITHHHHDHTADLGVLGYAVLLSRLMQQRTRELPIYMPAGNAELRRELQSEPLIQVHSIDEQSMVALDEMTLSFRKTVHPVFCLGVRVELQGKVFAFSSDSSFSNTLVELASNADLFLCEASMYDGQEEQAKKAGHLTAGQAGVVGAEAAAKRLVLTHYPHYGDLTQLKEQAQQRFGKTVDMVHTRQVFTV